MGASRKCASASWSAQLDTRSSQEANRWNSSFPKFFVCFSSRKTAMTSLFQNPSGKKLVGDVHQEFHSPLTDDAAPEPHGKFSKLCRVPAARLYYFLEKVLHLFRVRRRPTIL